MLEFFLPHPSYSGPVASDFSGAAMVTLARVFFILISAVVLAGCPWPYPVYKEVQPSSQITVLDESGARRIGVGVD
jgi:hypothetical protein